MSSDWTCAGLSRLCISSSNKLNFTLPLESHSFGMIPSGLLICGKYTLLYLTSVLGVLCWFISHREVDPLHPVTLLGSLRRDSCLLGLSEDSREGEIRCLCWPWRKPRKPRNWACGQIPPPRARLSVQGSRLPEAERQMFVVVSAMFGSCFRTARGQWHRPAGLKFCSCPVPPPLPPKLSPAILAPILISSWTKDSLDFESTDWCFPLPHSRPSCTCHQLHALVSPQGALSKAPRSWPPPSLWHLIYCAVALGLLFYYIL